MNKLFLVSFVIFVFLLCLGLLQLFIPKRHVLLGAWTQGLFNPTTQQLHPEKLQQFQNLIHKKVSIVHYYLGWEKLDNPTLIQQFRSLNQLGWQPMLSVNPYYFSNCPASTLPLYRAIAQGACDAFLKKAGKNLAKIQKPFFLELAWEMNNNQNSWSIQTTGSTSQDFIAAWQHIHTIFKIEQAEKIVWVFCPNIPNIPSLPYSALYPGDKYVDWTCLDGYNWGTTQPWSNWETFADIFTSSYQSMIHLAPSKPLMLGEVGTTDKGGNKAEWYTDMLTQQIPNNFPKIHAVVLFNENRTPEEQVNWEVNTSPASLNAFSKAIQSPFYQ